MIRLLSILAITAICATTLVVDFAIAQNSDACPTSLNCPSAEVEAAAKKMVQWKQGPFKMVKMEVSANSDQSADKDEKQQHKNEIRVEIGIDGSTILSSLPLLKNLFQKKPKSEVQSGVRIQFSDHPEPALMNDDPASKVRTASYTTPPVNDSPKCCQAAAGGGCCARPDPFTSPNQGCVTGDGCCDSAKGCCEAAKGCCDAAKGCCDAAKGCCDAAKGCCDHAKGCCGNALIHVFGTGPKSPGPCMHWVAEAGNDCPGCLTPPSPCFHCPMKNCQAGCCNEPRCETTMSSNVMLASFSEQAAVADHQRMQYMEELLELRVANAELKVALAATERHVEMMQRMSDLREQNAALRAELHLHQAMKSQHSMMPGPPLRPVPQVNRRPDMAPNQR